MDSIRSQGRMMWAILSAVLVLVTTAAHADGGEGYQSQQGTVLQGTADKRFERIPILLNSATLNGTPLSMAAVTNGQLVGTFQGQSIAGASFVGVTFSAVVSGQTYTFQITNAQQHTNVYSHILNMAWDYQVTWAGSGQAGYLCPQNTAALALPGHWEMSGSQNVLFNDPGSFYFACPPIENSTGYTGGGLAAKCTDWGYRPWVSTDSMADGRPGNLATTISDAFRYHAACVAMASADYCGQALPNTVSGTTIDMFDNQDMVPYTDPQDPTQTVHVSPGPFGASQDFFFESAWAGSAIDTLDGRKAYQGQALCLTKKRWSTLPFNGMCPQTLPDPRTNTGINPAHYCDDMSTSELSTKGALLFSYSTYIDAGLYRFTNTQTGQFVTTSNISIDKTTGAYRPVLNGVVSTQYASPPVFEGTVLTSHVPDTFPGRQSMAPLRRYRCSTRTSTIYLTQPESGSVSVPAGCVYDGATTQQTFEGYVYVANSSLATHPLYVWKNTTTGTYETTTQALSSPYSVVTWAFLPTLTDYEHAQTP